MQKRKVNRKDFDWLLGAEDYEPGMLDALAFVLLFVIFAVAFDNPIRYVINP